LPFTERIAPGAFTRTLKSKNDIRAYVNHDDRLLLGSTRAKTLRIEDRADGGYVEIDLPNTTWGNDIRELVKRGDITGMSFGFSTVKDSWSPNGNERTLAEVRLHEVSVVTGVPAYPQTTASVRSWLVPAKRASVDADQLAAAIAELQAGNTLTAEQAAMLMNVIEAMQTSEDVPVDPANMDDVVAVEPITEIGYDGPMDGQQHGSEDIEVTASIPVSLLLKQIDLLAKSVNS
jgi:HK97 family phage prohead protease